MAFSRAGIEKAWNSVTSKAAELRQGAAGMIEGAKNSKAGGMVSDSAAAIHGIGLHTLGGAAMGGTINAAAYANDGAFTGADSGASAFLSGAGYGAAAGMGLGMMHAKKYAAYNAAKRTNSKLKQGTMTKARKPLTENEKLAEQYSTDNKRSILQMRNLKEKISKTGREYSSAGVLNQQIRNGMDVPLNTSTDGMLSVKNLRGGPANTIPKVNYNPPNVNNGKLQLLPNTPDLQMPSVNFGNNTPHQIQSPNYGLAPKGKF